MWSMIQLVLFQQCFLNSRDEYFRFAHILTGF
jgi:hypothetical protein